MKPEDVLKLVNAGFTKAEILQLAAEPANEPAPEPTPEPTPEPDPEPTTAPEDMSASFNKMMDDFRSMFESKLSDLQKANLRTASIDVKPEKVPEDLIAQIIRPTAKERNK